MLLTIIVALGLTLVHGESDLTIKQLGDIRMEKLKGTGFEHDTYTSGFSVGSCYAYKYNLLLKLEYKDEPGQPDEKLLVFVTELYDNIGNRETKQHLVTLKKTDRVKTVSLRLEIPYACVCDVPEEDIDLRSKVTIRCEMGEKVVIEDLYEGERKKGSVLYSCNSDYPAANAFFTGQSSLKESLIDKIVSADVRSNITVSNSAGESMCVDVRESVAVNEKVAPNRTCHHKFFVPQRCAIWKIFECDLQETDYQDLKKRAITSTWNVHASSKALGWADEFKNERTKYVGSEYYKK